MQAPSESKPVSQPPIATQVSEPQLIMSTTSAITQHTDNKDQGPSSESVLFNSKDAIKNVSESVISSNKDIKNKSTKESTGNEPSFALRKSFSVSNFRVIDSSSRSVSDELQQKLNKRLNKEADINALEKLETTVKQNMDKSKTTAKNTNDANPDKGKHDGVTEKEVSLFIYYCIAKLELMRNTYSYTILVCGMLITTFIVHVRHTVDLGFSQRESKLGAVSLKQGCRGTALRKL